VPDIKKITGNVLQYWDLPTPACWVATQHWIHTTPNYNINTVQTGTWQRDTC